ncbi:hypothetical protein MHU86_194 [Fragilaria crotonensis]|nr:hypothetical protein MHU86_194 [Fragilaria crotonensis]
MSSSSQSSPLEPAGDPGALLKSSFRKKRPKIPPVTPADTNQGLTNQQSGGYALPRSYRPVVTRKRDPLEQIQQQQQRQQLQRRRRQLRGKNAASSSSASSGDDRSVGTFSTTYTQTSRVSDVSISTFDPILHQDDPFYMDVQQKIAKSLRPSKTPIECFDLEHEKAEEHVQDGLGHCLHQQLDAEGRPESVKMSLDVDNVVEIEDVDIEEVDRQIKGEPSITFHPKFSATIGPDDDWIDPETLEVPDILRNDKGDTEVSPKGSFLHRNRCIILGMSLLAVIVIVIGVVIPTTMSSPASTPQPSPAPTSLEGAVRDSLQDVLIQGSSSVMPSYQLPSSTLDWLVQHALNSNSPAGTETSVVEQWQPEELLQLAALVSIYGSTVGTNWTFQDSWLSFEVGICKWWGVVCDDSGRIVTALELYSNGLQGPIPLEIGFLTNLVSLELHENALNGTLPSSLSLLTALQELTLNNNLLTGELPLSLPPNLTVLDLDYNSLAGTLSDDLLLSNLLSLERLGLGGNSFWGSMPSSLGGLTNLTTLSLHDNAFTGNLETMNLEVLTALQYIWISNNKLTGTVPEFLGDMPDLRWLLFEENALGGSIPSSFGDLRRVQRMDFSNTGLTGTLPSTLSNWRYIEYFNVARNNLIGTIPTDFGFMTSLQYVDLSENSLTGTLPTELGMWVTLLGMDVSSNALVGTMPDALCSRSPPPDMTADCGSSSVELVCTCCSPCL